ncbi:MAG: prepilin-type N-terminal cleavage/methylation domain-containing protein [Patescibacteria group bacterium]|nr:prepilin-type N-terminal cleavage/methylation domain-containing protein [Patescibacteria group bacterium]
MKNKGFTLIELLIVIALLGALAVGLLAAVDPFEQLKKGGDTATRNTVSEFYNASIRYYASHNQFPWGTATFATVSTLNDMGESISAIITTGELKQKFIELATTGRLAKISVYSSGADQISVCFRPDSKSFRQDQNTIFDPSGGPLDGCPSTGTCYWCVQ